MKRLGSPDEVAALLDFRHGADVARIKLSAAAEPWDGRGMTPPAQRLLVRSITEPGLWISMIYTFDHGAHNSGWWRNSDYETCRHLSILAMEKSHRFAMAQVPTSVYVDMPEAELRAWARIWFGTDLHKAWNEPPADLYDKYRDAPASRYTHHVRVFTDRQMNAIIPEGEVYGLKPFDDGSSPEKIHR